MKRTILLACIALFSISCNNDDTPTDIIPDQSPIALQVSGSIAGNETAALRLSGTSWNPGDAIGIFMLEGEQILETNRKYTCASGANFSPATSDQTIWFPIDDNAPKVDFIAYYPFHSSQNGLSFPIDLSSQSDQATLDLLTADKVTGKDKLNPSVTLPFKHRLVKMELTILPGTGLAAADLAGMTVALSEQYTAGSCDLGTGAVVSTGKTGPLSLKGTAEGNFAEATLLPAKAASGRILSFTLTSGDIFRYSIPSDRVFNAGEKHAYTITLNRTGVNVSATITDWTEVTGNGIAR